MKKTKFEIQEFKKDKDSPGHVCIKIYGDEKHTILLKHIHIEQDGTIT